MDDNVNKEIYAQNQQLKLQKQGAKSAYKTSPIKKPERRSDVFIVNSEHQVTIVNLEEVTKEIQHLQ